MINSRVLFTTAIEGTNVHEWGTVKDKVLQEGNTGYLVSFLMPNETHGAQTTLIVIKPTEIELIEE